MAPFSTRDAAYMNLALRLAGRAKGTTFPNPAVGAVVVKGRKIVGRGATDPCGGPHAEVKALAQAGSRSRGATLYVTLEPCNHHGRTPPCVDAIVAAGVRRVVAAVKDSNPLVNGRGIRNLRSRGVAVDTELLAERARRLNEDHLWAVRQGRAWVTLKLALTWDGRIADAAGTSKWITSAAMRRFVHVLRRNHAGIAVGRRTLAADNPRLTVRPATGASPARFVFSSHESLPRRGHFVSGARRIRSVIVVAGGVRRSIRVRGDGVEVWRTGSADPVKSMRSFLAMAFAEGVTGVLFEGGRRIASFLLENGLVNRLYLCYGNRILGGGIDGFRFARSLPLRRATRLGSVEVRRIGDNVVVSGILRR